MYWASSSAVSAASVSCLINGASTPSLPVIACPDWIAFRALL